LLLVWNTFVFEFVCTVRIVRISVVITTLRQCR
jgi:hypothetical protein